MLRFILFVRRTPKDERMMSKFYLPFFSSFSLLFCFVLFVCCFFSINAPQSHFSSEDDSFEGCFEVYRSFYFHLNDFPRILTRVRVVWI